MPGSTRSRCIMAGFIKKLIFICYLCLAICHLSLGVSLKEPRLAEDLGVHNTRSHDALSSDARVSLVIDHLCFKSQMSGSAWSKSIDFMYDVRNSLLKIIMQKCWSAVRVNLIVECSILDIARVSLGNDIFSATVNWVKRSRKLGSYQQDVISCWRQQIS